MTHRPDHSAIHSPANSCSSCVKNGLLHGSLQFFTSWIVFFIMATLVLYQWSFGPSGISGFLQRQSHSFALVSTGEPTQFFWFFFVHFCAFFGGRVDDGVVPVSSSSKWLGFSMHNESGLFGVGRLSQLNLSGHWKLYCCIIGAQPSRARSHTPRHAGTGLWYSSKQMGVYIEHKKNFKSAEHLISTRGQNWWTYTRSISKREIRNLQKHTDLCKTLTSIPASSCVSCENSFGYDVKLYPIPLHIGIVISSHFGFFPDDIWYVSPE